MDWLISFIRWTAWPMEKPASYGAFHLLFFFIGLLVCVGLALLLRKSNERQNRIVLLVCASFLLLTELYKQLFYVYVMADTPSYVWWIFPFQLCSVPMYLCFVAPFLKKGRLQNAMYNFLVAFNLMSGFVAFVEPSGLVHEYWTLTLHAFVWHMMLVFIGLYLGFSGRAARKWSDYLWALLVFFGLSAVAFGINVALERVSGGSVNMFYVGPAVSPIIVFKDIAAKYGWYVNTPLYLLCLSAAFLFWLPFRLVQRRKARLAQAASV